ncbi:MAG: hypothetical protein OEV81_08720 [Betaproteobacteria bacterium]|nr:hypothetical protein [Betaproteobacteria bacterium]MDH5219747.1 hypothetical protein [Betaproteobacteria bacterium]MDH5350494.1 hypothetical protein [Betaproteobacteria bacterium]
MKLGYATWGIALTVALAAAWTLGRFLPALSFPGAAASFQWVTLANTVLAASTAMYAMHFWVRSDAVGRVASGLAALGALGVLAGLGIAAWWSGEARCGLYEGTALLSAAAVFCYLALERVYCSREAGIVVMPAVMLAVACEMWLISRGLAQSWPLHEGFGAYWEAGYRLAMALGYGSIALAGGLAALALDADRRIAPSCGGEDWLRTALALGAPLLLVAAGMGAAWLLLEARAPARAAVFLLQAALVMGAAALAWRRMRRLEPARQAKLALGVFVVATGALHAAGPAGALFA